MQAQIISILKLICSITINLNNLTFVNRKTLISVMTYSYDKILQSH